MRLAALVADLGHPRVRFSEHLTIEGAEGWRRVLEQSPSPTPPEERRLLELLLAHAGVNLDPLPSWVCPELVATKAARDRLRAWVDADSVAPTADDLVRKLRYMGDSEIREVVLIALHERIPPCVVECVLDEFLFVGVGWSAGGYMMRVAAPPGPRLSLIPLSGASRDAEIVMDLVLHECAHGYTLSAPKALIATESYYNECALELLRAARDDDRMREILEDQRHDERAADALARAWGGRLTCTDERATEYTKREAARLAAVYLL
jgi:hypothetical protein